MKEVREAHEDYPVKQPNKQTKMCKEEGEECQKNHGSWVSREDFRRS